MNDSGRGGDGSNASIKGSRATSRLAVMAGQQAMGSFFIRRDAMGGGSAWTREKDGNDGCSKLWVGFIGR
jgi:hypothetical protein